MNTSHCGDGEARRIAADLAAKYGAEALAFVKSRADQAFAIGDDLARSIWDRVRRAVVELSACRPSYFAEPRRVDAFLSAP